MINRIKNDQKGLFNKFFPTFVLFATVILGIIFWSYFVLEADKNIKGSEMRNQSLLQVQAKEITTTIEDLFMDLNEISSRSIIINYLDTPNKAHKAILEKKISTYLKKKKLYNSIQIINPQKNRYLSITYTNNQFTLTERNIKDSDYTAQELNPGETTGVQISQIHSLEDIKKCSNLCNKAITISMYVFNARREPSILSLSCSFQNILDKMRNDKQILHYNENTIGRLFMISENEDNVFDIDNNLVINKYKENTPPIPYSVIQRIELEKKQQNGSFITKDGFVNFFSINLGETLKNTLIGNKIGFDLSKKFGNHEYKLVSLISIDQYHEIRSKELSRLVAIYLVILFLLIIISYLAAMTLSNRIYNQTLLKKSAKKLTEVNNTKDKFIKILAHDLKNPIMTIQGFSYIIKNDDPSFSSEQKKHYAEIIVQSTQNMVQLIDDVLAWSKSQNGALIVNKTITQVNSVIESTIEILKPQALKKEININCEFKNNISLEIDQNMLISIIRNLTSNAIKFSFRGSTITIKTQTNGDFCEILIIDHGVGITPSVQKKLFNVGEKIYSKGTENEKGTGLGLILCKEFTLKNSGKIDIISKPNEGTTIQLIFPLPKSGEQ
ncbi:HAMP domain-containing histidine kinase [Halosquirtibacter laminarini]|uniref:HAMP domain-containing histidine kinase n=1 Tax=Halosquirtibacter laminarini TaxID=3374600 RepID=A0AC61NGB3_9BACT|nr:HAMP domain-containing histidine kinase [Prolixibacteraceae bacterium]